MTARFLSVITVSLLCSIPGAGNANDRASAMSKPNLRLNFLVSPKQKKVDPAPLSFQIQAKLIRLFHKKSFM